MRASEMLAGIVIQVKIVTIKNNACINSELSILHSLSSVIRRWWNIHSNFILPINIVSVSVTDKPSIDTCATVAFGPNGEKKASKSVGLTTECQYQSDFYGNFMPTSFQFDLMTSFSVDASLFPKRPKYIDTENFGISDAQIELILQTVNGK